MPKPSAAKQKRKLPQNNVNRPRNLRKSDLVEQIRECCEEFSTIYIFDLVNSRTSLLKQVRQQFKEDGSRFVFGKTKVMQIALGRTAEEALQPGLDKLGKRLIECSSSNVGLFFTNSKPKVVEEKIASISEMDFARSGFVATRTVELKAGPIIGQPSSMLEPLRALKLPVALKKGVIELENDYVVCNTGDTLSVEQARILKLFGVMLSEFRIRLRWRWADDGVLKELKGNMEIEEDNGNDIE
jgi:mRNA turnover protein 4